MLAVDRRHYVSSPSDAYLDQPVGIGDGQTISAPHMHAMCLEAVEPFVKPNSKILDVGSGSGYLAAALAALAGPGSRVFGVEQYPALVKKSIASVIADGKGEWLEGDKPRLSLLLADGSLGLPTEGPFDVIHVGAAAPRAPTALISQLAQPGILIVPIGRTGFAQDLMQFVKDANGKMSQKSLMAVQYVPLVMAPSA
jgi:protein-L-isoaspartate(D-aspartate) O-methyltransferase